MNILIYANVEIVVKVIQTRAEGLTMASRDETRQVCKIAVDVL